MKSISIYPSKERIESAVRGVAKLPGQSRRLKPYGLALLFVALAALLRWALPEVLGPTPFLVFYLAWVAAAALGGLGPGLLATVASWLCIDLLFDPTNRLINFADPTTTGRLGGPPGRRAGRQPRGRQDATRASSRASAGLGAVGKPEAAGRNREFGDGCDHFRGRAAAHRVVQPRRREDVWVQRGRDHRSAVGAADSRTVSPSAPGAYSRLRRHGRDDAAHGRAGRNQRSARQWRGVFHRGVHLSDPRGRRQTLYGDPARYHGAETGRRGPAADQ